MKKITETQVRKKVLFLFCKNFLTRDVEGQYLSIADVEVKAVKGLEKYIEKKKGSSEVGLDSYIARYSLSAQTLNALYDAGYDFIVRASYRFHGKFYNTEHHATLNEKLGIA
ncbi:MAG: hypothetical protein ACK5N8_05505 [Alphaproteobacteria bacterium]